MNCLPSLDLYIETWEYCKILMLLVVCQNKGYVDEPLDGNFTVWPVNNSTYTYLHNYTILFTLTGRTPEEVVRRYLQKVRNPPEEVIFSKDSFIS